MPVPHAVAELEAEVARLDAALAPAATELIDWSDPGALENLGRRFEAADPLDRVGVRSRTEAALWAIIARYEKGDSAERALIRGLFDRYTAFRWAAHLPQAWDGAADFRARLILLSASDQGADTRDEILTLQSLCTRARTLGIDIAPILREVAALSSDVDRYGLGSTKQIILSYGAAWSRSHLS